ncbi:N-formylglutamate amidohydrolase [Bremerella cremea]|uniref:N-formylglutamate amidohydrolase n=1 Tax=Bremerella cremea TaxID=1031537 RepID=A0A368KRE8_9BACT|nr:N-formylglutamate amidohydrolase [Bremerella cremea]RCS49423.1 N-formylglutamate amidohydrolase [Bremerella cremea]
MQPQRSAILLTCEHAGNQVPQQYATLFAGHEALLDSHRGWDPGTLRMGNHFASKLHATLVFREVTRLLVDLNRSESNRVIFSSIVRELPLEQREEILQLHYRPFRREVLQWINDKVAKGTFVRHLSLHSFTPQLGNQVRQAEIGLLYDPARKHEQEICQRWGSELRKEFPGFRVRMNYPYRGISDGHTSAMRKVFSAEQYAGIELEVNQQLFAKPSEEVGQMIAGLCRSYQKTLENDHAGN